jgi:hypothetical protein
MASALLLQKFSVNIHTSAMARVNARDRAQAALGILRANDLQETVDILLEWDEFEDEDPDELAEALAYYNSTLIKPGDLTSEDLLAGFDGGEVGSSKGWAELARQKGVTENEALKLLELASS